MQASEVNGEIAYRCSMCGTPYKSRLAARACEDEHLDERNRAGKAVRH